MLRNSPRCVDLPPGAKSAILGRIGEALPMLIFGKLLDPARTALMHRAATLCLFPDKLILAVAGQVALPELSRQARQGTDLKATYLKALVLVSGVQWPFMALLAILAPQIVALLLGSQWTQTVPLVRIIAPAIMVSLPISLQYSALVASGGVHLLPRLLAAQLTVTAVALSATAPYGLEAAAWSMLVAIPLNALLSLAAVRSRFAFRWAELMAALAPSMFATLASAAGPLALALYSPSPMPWTFAAAAAGLGGAGWMLGLLAVRHALVRLLAPKLGFSAR
jgi:O-antigen/teichoic acid export membrane protein